MGVPNYPKNFADEWTQVKRDIKNAFTTGNLRTGMAKIGARVIEITGELILNAGARFAAKYDNNVNAFEIRQADYNGGVVGQVLIRRYNGSAVFQVFGGPSEKGFFSIQDPEGNVILSDDGFSGKGLARPYLSYNVVRTSDLLLPPDLTTSTTFVPHITIAGEVQHPRITVTAHVYGSGTDKAQVRLVDPDSGGAVIATSAVNVDQFVTLTGNHPNYEFGKDFKYDLEIRRTSGTGGGVGLAVTKALGIQS